MHVHTNIKVPSSGDIALRTILPRFQQDNRCLRKTAKLGTLKMKAICPSKTCVCNFVVWRNSPPGALATSLLGLRAHAHVETHYDAVQSVGLLWTSDQLVAESATYTTRNKHKGRKSMTPAVFEPAISGSERPQTHASTHTIIHFNLHKWRTCSSHRLYWLNKFAQLVVILFSGSAPLFFLEYRLSIEYAD